MSDERQAWITGMGQIGLDPSDPFLKGYPLADTEEPELLRTRELVGGCSGTTGAEV